MGKIPPRVIRVSLTEMYRQMRRVAMMTMKHLMNMEMFVLRPSLMTPVSELILLRISPVFVSSKNPTSLLINCKNKSY